MYPQNHPSLFRFVVPVFPAVSTFGTFAPTPVPPVITLFSTSVIAFAALVEYTLLFFVEDDIISSPSEVVILEIHVGSLYTPSFFNVAYPAAISSDVVPFLKPPIHVV